MELRPGETTIVSWKKLLKEAVIRRRFRNHAFFFQDGLFHFLDIFIDGFILSSFVKRNPPFGFRLIPESKGFFLLFHSFAFALFPFPFFQEVQIVGVSTVV